MEIDGGKNQANGRGPNIERVVLKCAWVRETFQADN